MTSGREIEAEDARGASALVAAARAVRTINRMSPEQAQAAGVSAEDASSYVAVTPGKANLGKLSSRSAWRYIESVGLNNGTGLMRPQDYAGVVTAWEWPDAESAIEAIEPEAFEAIKAQLTGGTHPRNPSKGCAGEVIADVLGMSFDEKSTKAKAERLLKGWLAAGKLVVTNKKDPAQGYRSRDFVDVPTIDPVGV